jgi:hypothetical protein
MCNLRACHVFQAVFSPPKGFLAQVKKRLEKPWADSPFPDLHKAITPCSERKGNIMSNKPTHVVYHVKSYQSNGETKDIWTRIGAAWLHEDGDGFNQQLDMVPLDGRIVTRRAKAKDDLPDEAAA